MILPRDAERTQRAEAAIGVTPLRLPREPKKQNERISKDIRQIVNLYDSVQKQNERISKDIQRILSDTVPRIRPK